MAPSLEKLLLELASREAGTRKVVPGETVPFDADGRVFFRAPPYQGLSVESVPALQSVRYTSKRGRVPDGSRAILTLHHGTGAPYSHSGAMLSALNTLTSGPSQKQSGFVPDLQKDPRYLYLAAEAVDAPGHGGGPDLTNFQSLDLTVDWLAAQFRDLKKFSLPLFPLTRSGAAGPMVRLNQKFPGLIDGMILMSPLHPKGKQHSMSFLTAAASKPPDHPDYVVIRWDAINWINGLYEEIASGGHWPTGSHPFGATPVLILMGRKDPQISAEARAEFIRYALPPGDSRDPLALAKIDDENVVLKNGSIWYVQVAAADHDVLENRDRESAVTAKWAYGMIFEFLRGVTGG